MNARNLSITKLFAVTLLVGLSAASHATAAEPLTFGNYTDKTITYQAGYKDERGEFHWKTMPALGPGQRHTFNVEDPKNRPLWVQWEITPGKKSMNWLYTDRGNLSSGLFYDRNSGQTNLSSVAPLK